MHKRTPVSTNTSYIMHLRYKPVEAHADTVLAMHAIPIATRIMSISRNADERICNDYCIISVISIYTCEHQIYNI